MLNKKWSSLDDNCKTGGLKRGHIGEYFAEMQFMLYGFEVYKPLVDDRGIDFIIKNTNGLNFDIQVKSIIGYDNIFISRTKFNTNNKYLYLVAIQYFDDQEPEMYIVPSVKWTEPNTVFYDSGTDTKEPQYGLRLNKKNCDFLEQFKFEKYIEYIKCKKE